MIKIAAFPKCWIDEICNGKMSFFEWIDIARDLECDGLEIYAKFLISHDDEYLHKIKEYAWDRGMVIPMMCCSPDFTRSEAEKRQIEIDQQKKMIDITARLGGSFCRVLSGQNRPNISVEQGIKYVVECIKACLPAAEKNNVTLVLENHYKDGFWKYIEFAQSREIFLEIVNQIDHELFGVQYDPSNAIIAGDDPIELLDSVIGKVKTMHASDRFLLPGYQLKDLSKAEGELGYHKGLCHGVVGKGLNDYDAIFSRLARAGFDGWISIEDGMNGMDEMRDSIKFLMKMRSKYSTKKITSQ